MEDWKFEPARDLDLGPGERVRSHRRECGLLECLAHQAWWGLTRTALAVWHRLEITGRERIPREPPFVVVANHSSHLDALALASAIPWRLRDRVFSLAAGDVFFDSPLASTFSAWALNALPVWRRSVGSHAIHDLRRRLLEEPCSYVLFPEGTRSRDGVMKPFKPGLGMLVAGTAVPVVPCRLQGAFEALPPSGRIPRPGKIVLHIGEPLRFADLPDERAGWESAAARTEEAVRALTPARGRATFPGGDRA